jgi:hypothetical protein
VEPTRLQKKREAKKQMSKKHIGRSWEKELSPVVRDRRNWKELMFLWNDGHYY